MQSVSSKALDLQTTWLADSFKEGENPLSQGCSGQGGMNC